jgi:hypothetical protein
MTEVRRQAIEQSRKRYENASNAFMAITDTINIPELRLGAQALRSMIDAQIDLVTALVLEDSLTQAERIRTEVERQFAAWRDDVPFDGDDQ